jgi:DNA-binding transcriptional regulator YhcF (GntR family)
MINEIDKSIVLEEDFSLSPYLLVKNKIVDDIKQSSLVQGEKIPSVRKLAVQESVSPATVQRAIRELVSEGVLIAKDRSGVFVSGQQMELDTTTVGLLLSQSPNQNSNAFTGYLAPLIQVLQQKLMEEGVSLLSTPCVKRDVRPDRNFLSRQPAYDRPEDASYTWRA